MLPNFIIGGTNKAGTTSVFRYLSDHPQVCGSKVKETGFFIREFTGDPVEDQRRLGSYFEHYRDEHSICVEASTGYLAQAEEVIPRIRVLLGSPKLMFILRAPADRLYSYYHFHIGQLSIPKTVSFERYVELCMQYEAGRLDLSGVAFDERHLRALRYGNYASYLKHYLDAFAKDKVKIMLFDALREDPRKFMQEVSGFLDIDETFYSTYRFEKTNATFSSKNKRLHRIAVLLNGRLERFLRQRPALKNSLVRIYKKINMERQGYLTMAKNTRGQLIDYYRRDMKEFERVLERQLPDNWW